MTDSLNAITARYCERMTLLRDTFNAQGYLLAQSIRDLDYSILLTKNTTADSQWRVTSFRDKEPIGHREYDALEGRSPALNAFQEFAGQDMKLVTRQP